MSRAADLLTCACPSCERRRRSRIGGSAPTRAGRTPVVEPAAQNLALLAGLAAVPLIMAAGFLAAALR